MRQNASVEAYLDSYDTLKVEVSRRYYNGLCERFYVKDRQGKMIHCQMKRTEEFDLFRRYLLVLDEELEFSKEYELVCNQGYRAPIQFRYIVQTERFEQQFFYDKEDLGSFVIENKTYFNLWAPTATEITLSLIYPQHKERISMQRDWHGVWRTVVNHDLTGIRYTYWVAVNGEITETVDPYGKSSDCNGRHSVVVNTEKIKKFKTRPIVLEHPTDAILYELSVRDFTINPSTGTQSHGTFEALIEQGTRYQGKKTGFDYLTELGITHVQLMPVCDFFTVDESFRPGQYNWGYDPYQYMTLEGSYSSDPEDGLARVNEFLDLVNAFHQQGIGVNLDVVFNHHYDVGLSSFERCVPYYYFRVNENMALSNGSFCGNDIESSRLMVQKFIIDSCAYFVDVFGVDGFRFDLMGIMDTDTMNKLEKRIHQLNPSALLYGEGWNMPTALPDDKKCTIDNQRKVPHVAFFNDYFRDHLKGRTSEFEKNHRGYLTGDEALLEASKYCLCGMAHPDLFHYFDQPGQSINYIECHDNATLWDKMKFCCNDEVREIRLQRQKLIMAILLLSQGIPFIHSGQEFCRSKTGYDNTYNMPDRINQIDWDRKNRNSEVVQYTKDCIALRNQCAAFRLFSKELIQKHVQFDTLKSVLIYKLVDVGSLSDFEEIQVFINPFKEDETIRADGFVCILDEEGSCYKPLSNFRIPAYSVQVIAKEKN